ncbi:M64 family metallopeptidase [Actinoplanes sp. NBRC 103695]|uniref:M64 family metallopeptidase n=1 Tax=Actinoplanes sp. NBRC 103695 TaxID=3032202 RepID=UPI0024A455BA|nr:M64 family metallopeptidase [Actinoplanes sp. NBRC 103695]GLY99009.1 peptidase [Actinoplanes sp. NBRC 103695]
MRRILVAAFLSLGLLATPSIAYAAADPLPAPKVTPIQVTGPAAERLNLVILGDGYQADQQSLFRADVDRNLAVMWATEPFRSYRDYVNVYAVEVASNDYGVRCDPDGRVRHPDGTIRDTGEREGPIDTKDTALRMIFQNGCADPLARGVVYGGAPVGCESNPGPAPCETGNQALNRIVDTYVAPALGIPRTAQNLQTLAIFNTFTYGGIGGTQATTSGGSPQGPLISLHEIGHSLGTLADEYPYSSRDVVRPCYTGPEPGSFHHTVYTDEQQMIADQHKWFRWLGEESLSGGRIGLHESGGTYPCGQRRPSEHSMMRWLGFDWDQIGRENMVARITGLRNAGQMVVRSTQAAQPTKDKNAIMPLASLGHDAGTVPRDSVLWVEAGRPRNHTLDFTWRAGGNVIGTGQNLDLGLAGLTPGTVVQVEVRDPVGPDGIDWVRNPSANNAAADSGFNGPRFVQTRSWTVGPGYALPSRPAAEVTASTITGQPVARDEIVFVETNHPADRIARVSWALDGRPVANPANSRTLDLGAKRLPEGNHTLTATVTDRGTTDSVSWTIDNTPPTAARTLSAPLTTLPGRVEHPVYFDGWDMWLAPADDQPGRYVVGQFRLDGDGWFNYFGFPERPMPDSPFHFSHSGTVVKALTYGNLGTGGLSRAAFEQTLPDDHPAGGFVPGFGTHTVEHRAIDPAGNIGPAGSYRATVLPGAAPACTTTLTGKQSTVVAATGVTCLTDAQVRGAVTVRPSASLVVRDSRIAGAVNASGAAAVQIFGSTLVGAVRITGTTRDVTIAGATFKGALALRDNTQVTSNERFTRLAGAYGPILSGSRVTGTLTCSGNSAKVADFGAPTVVTGTRTGDCAGA